MNFTNFINYFVDPRGVEPLTYPCHGYMLPLYHGPNFIVFSIKDLVLSIKGASVSGIKGFIP